jgi:chloramphenicol-sensitive protein RarD
MADADGARRRVLGTLFGIGAFAFWGFVPLYWRRITAVPSDILLAHRVIWTFVLLSVFLTVSGRWRSWWLLVSAPRRLGILALSGVLIGVNWFVYIWSVTHERVLDASLGYFINPLVVIGLGMIVFKERLTVLKRFALLLAGAGVAVVAVGLKTGPWIALILAGSFGTYGMLKKLTDADAFISLHVEASVLLVPAALYLGLAARNAPAMGADAVQNILIVSVGVITILPLILFTKSAQMIALSEVGFLQYLAPSINLLLGVFAFGEDFTTTHAVSFSLIWGALVLSSISQVSELRGRRANVRKSKGIC